MRKCSKCKENREICEFYKKSQSKDGLDSWCKDCKRACDKDYRDRNANKLIKQSQKYYSKNKNAINSYKKGWYEKNKERILKLRKKYYEENKENILDKNAEWRKNNKEKKNAQDKKYMKENRDYLRERRRNIPQIRIACNLRRRMHSAIKNNQKVGSAVRDLGCSVVELKDYLESKFQSKMNWDNYGYYGWHIDHIKPLSSFDLADREQFLKACHYTNLQPLWMKDNLSKGAKLI